MKIEQAVAVPAQRESTKSHWEDFWKNKKEVREVYSNNDRVLRNLLKVTDLTDKKVLEVGAGTGRDSFKLTTYGASIFMLDYAAASLQIIKKVAAEEKVDVNMIGGDAFGLPFDDGTFDVVFHQGLLEHFREKDARRLLEENIRVLKKGGLLLVDVPQRYHIYTAMKHILIAIDKWFAGWETEFSIGELSNLLSSLQLQPVYRYGEWMYPSLFYRILREGFLKIGVKLPLYPKASNFTADLRARLRGSFSTNLALHTGISVGVIARK